MLNDKIRENGMATQVKFLEDLQTLASLCKRRGFIFQSSEIYGGLNSCYDYGPLGVALKQNLKDLWWQDMVTRRDIVGIDAAILMHPQVWKASGHLDGFSDPLIQCRDCKMRCRADEHPESQAKCPYCQSSNVTEAKAFHLMFKTFIGAMEDSSCEIYLRPETAQGIFVNFENVATSMRKKIPFGIAQIGKSFRNEITPGHFIFRMREFEQMEMQYFVQPGKDAECFEQWKDIRYQFYQKLNFKTNHIRFKEHGPDQLAHYAKSAFDIEYEFPMGWQEVEGIHNRTDFDLKQHQKFSGKKLEYFDEQQKEKFLPYVIETAVGCDRLVLLALCDAYQQEEIADSKDTRIVMKFHPYIAPVTVALLPLSKKSNLIEMSKKLYDEICKDFILENLSIQYDETGSIGKRYRRQDEIGTPFCVTVDFESLEDKKVTVRDRDSMTQERLDISHLSSYLRDQLKKVSF